MGEHTIDQIPGQKLDKGESNNENPYGKLSEEAWNDLYSFEDRESPKLPDEGRSALEFIEEERNLHGKAIQSNDRPDLLRRNMDSATQGEIKEAKQEISFFITGVESQRDRRLVEGIAQGIVEGDLGQVASVVAALNNNPEALQRYVNKTNEAFLKAGVDVSLTMAANGKLQISEKGDSRYVEINPATGEAKAFQHALTDDGTPVVRPLENAKSVLKEIGNQAVGDILGNNTAVAALPDLEIPPDGSIEPQPKPADRPEQIPDNGLNPGFPNYLPRFDEQLPPDKWLPRSGSPYSYKNVMPEQDGKTSKGK